MRLLDTPEWNGLNTAERTMVGHVYGNGGPYTTALSAGARKVVLALEATGLVTVTWRERDAVIELREIGWSQ
jgi:hypothetical protein